jgi:hypothetical protein
MTSKRFKTSIWMILAVGSAALAAGGPPADKPGGRPGGATAGNSLSFPVIFSDGVTPAGEYVDLAEWIFYSGPWSDANGDGVYDQCTTGVPSGTPVPDQYVCYQDIADPDLRVWWLQERAANRWQVFDPRNSDSQAAGTVDFGDIIVSALDWGDLLESSTSIGAKKVRTEVSLLQDAHSSGPPFTDYLAEPVGGEGAEDVVGCMSGTDCFAAVRMSGAVPGTEQSIDEVQGTDFGADVGNVPGTRELIDPASVRFETDPARGYEATLYSSCARLLIQPLTEGQTPVWNDTTGEWDDAGDPVINVRALDGAYSAEINAGGTMLYGYNWTTRGLTAGKYRLTFVLDGPGSGEYACPELKTYFGTETRVFVTPAVDEGEVTIAAEGSSNQAYVVPGCGTFGEGEGEGVDCVQRGGLSYIDVNLGKTTGGGGGKPSRP